MKINLNINQKKSKISTISLILLLTLSAIIIALPSTTAQEPISTTPFAYVNAMPDQVGVGQSVLIHFGIHLPTLWPQFGWQGLTVEVQRPDGSTDTLGPLGTDTTGGAGVNLVPDQIGTWRIRTVFPEQVAEAPTRGFPTGTIIEDAVSDWFEITVSAEPAAEYPGHQLPLEYWSRPINSQFWSWSEITGNWLAFWRPTIEAPYELPTRPGNSLAPETGHVLWAKPLFGGGFSALGGGLSSAETGVHATEDGDAYEGLFTPPVIMNGIIYFNKYKADGGSNVDQLVVAADLRTGEVIWEKSLDNRRLAFAQSFFFDGYNYHAVFQYLITTQGSTWRFYEPTDGRLVMTYTNVPGGGSSEMMFGPNGEVIIYTINLQDGWMTKWNSQWVLEAQKWIDVPDGPDSTFGSWYRRFMGTTLDGRIGIEWNVTIPSRADLPDTTRTQNVQRVRFLGDDVTLLGCNFDRGSPTGDPVTMWAITFTDRHLERWDNLQWVETSYSALLGPDGEGPLYDGLVPQKIYDNNVELAWVKTWEAPMPYANLNIEDANMEDDVFTVAFNDNPTDWGFRLSTGEELWGPKGPWHYQTNWSYESSNSWNLLVDGLYLIGGHGGTIHALNSQTGESVWNYTVVDEFNTYLFNNAWRFRMAIVADGKIYLEHTEHSPFDPKPPAAPFVCLNLTTGERLWELNLRGTEWGGTAAIGDSIVLMQNTYDQQVYAVGMGPTETTIAVQDNVVSLGDPVLVTGTVMDISSGTKDERIVSRFPKGVAAVSDDWMNMKHYMEYVYMQKERPMDTIGVPVKIQIYDPNGQYAWIGTTTTDSEGNYAYGFVPQLEGTYAVIATFDTNNGYWGSQSTTYLHVGPKSTISVPPYPGYQGPSAQDVANNVVNSLPANPTPEQISQAVINSLPEPTEPTLTVPEYQTIDIVIVILVALAIVIGVVILFKKK